MKALTLEIESKQIFVFPTELNQNLKELKKVLCDLDKNGSTELQQLRDDIRSWYNFTGKVDSMLKYLESKEDVMKHTNQSISALEIEEKKHFLEVIFLHSAFKDFKMI